MKDEIDVSQFRVVFCDSLEALQRLRELGLPAQARIRCESPAMLRKGVAGLESVEASLPAGRVGQFLSAFNVFVVKIFEDLQQIDATREVATCCTFGAFFAHRLLHKALSIEGADLSEPRLVVVPVSGNPKVDDVVAPVWDELLAGNPNLKIVRIPVAEPRFGKSMGGRPGSLAARFSRIGFERLAYQVFARLGAHWPKWLSRGHVLVLHDSNELTKECAGAFGLAGYRVFKIPKSKPGLGSLPTETKSAIERIVTAAYEKHFTGLFDPQISKILIGAITDGAIRHARQHYASAERWRQTLAPWRDGAKACFILHGSPKGGVDSGLHKAAREASIPVIGFQHGVRREIANWEIDVKILNENNFSDLLLSYNQHSAAYSGPENCFAFGPAIPIGMPSDFDLSQRSSIGRGSAKPHEMVFVSTALYRGNRQISTSSLTDVARAQREENLIHSVLAKVPHKLRFKPYPSLRYIDRDPILDAVKASGLHLVEDETDMRYMLDAHRVVITTAATSTVGWCVLSGLPLVFIDDPDFQPLTPAARADFEKAFFVFAANAPDFHDRLLAFLRQPIEAIERAHELKAAERRRVIETLFGMRGRGAGTRGCQLILNHFSEGRSLGH